MKVWSLQELGASGLFRDGDWVETKNQDPSGSIRLTQLADVGVGSFRNRSNRWMNTDQASALGVTALREGDILIARMPGPIGRACLVPSHLGDAVTVVDVAILRVDQTEVLPRYAMWMINSPQFQAEVLARQSGTTRKRISRKNLAGLTIPRRPLAQQRRIVEMVEEHMAHLDAADASLASAEQRIRAFEAAALESGFGTSAAPEATVPLSDLIDTVTAGKSLGTASAPASENAWGIIKVSAMTWGEFRPDQNKAIPAENAIPKFEIKSGDLLVSRANTHEYVGASVLVGPVRPRLLLSDKSLRLTPRSGISAEWLWRALQAPSAREQIRARATGTKDSMRNISQSALQEVRLPATNPERRRNAVARHNALSGASKRATAAVQEQEIRASALRRAVLAAAFSGQLMPLHRSED